VAARDGTCGHQCTGDADCVGCGSTGSCSCPDFGTPWTAISCSCVDTPLNAPAQPAANVADSTWPAQWTANVTSFVYLDFSNKTAVANGKFYYDGVGGHSRADWKPYINGKDASQVWIADVATGSSHYYVKSGPLCISFPITVPGTKVPVGVERPDWMANCGKLGIGKYVGREQVHVDGHAVWVDHFTCHVDDIDADQAITFQNWHSLGLDASLPKGLPLRVTGGNSAPDSQKGSPRLSTVWYSNFDIGPHSSTPDDFRKPSLVCIPVATEVASAYAGGDYAGGELSTADVFDATFHTKAHSLLEAVHSVNGHEQAAQAEVSSADMERAKTRRPRPAYQGSSFGSMNAVLNGYFKRMPSVIATKDCFEFSTDELRDLIGTHLHGAAASSLLEVYHAASDNRRRQTAELEELRGRWAQIDGHAQDASPSMHSSLTEMHRDGLCHQAVMWYVHHLGANARAAVGRKAVLPLLPLEQHAPPSVGGAHAMAVYTEYSNATSCQACHFAR